MTANEEQDVPPPDQAPGESAVVVATAPADSRCPICALVIIDGQTIMHTLPADTYVHAYCWDNR